MSYVTASNGEFRLDGKVFKNIGFNYYPLIINAASKANVQALFKACANVNCNVIRSWCFIEYMRKLNGSVIENNENTLKQIDMVLDEASKYNIKIILSLADNPTYLSKKTLCTWANTVYKAGLSTTYPYVGFFDSEYCRTIYKDTITMLSQRKNTINGKLYREDDSIFSLEGGNELRYDVFDSEGGTQNTTNSRNVSRIIDWINDTGSHIKDCFPNHLYSFGAMSHTWQWVQGDTVSNGSGYGVDYKKFSALNVIDYGDFHLYPNQSDNVNLMKYGQRLGYPDTVTGDGLVAQIKDYVKTFKDVGKPCMMGETGLVKEIKSSRMNYPLFPRHDYLKQLSNDFFQAGGSIILNWHAGLGKTSGSYDIALFAEGGESVNDNSNDTKLISYIAQKNSHINGKRIRVSDVKGITI